MYSGNDIPDALSIVTAVAAGRFLRARCVTNFQKPVTYGARAVIIPVAISAMALGHNSCTARATVERSRVGHARIAIRNADKRDARFRRLINQRSREFHVFFLLFNP